MSIKLSVCFVFAILILGSSCTFQKRLYRSGYWVQGRRSLTTTDQQDKNESSSPSSLQSSISENLYGLPFASFPEVNASMSQGNYTWEDSTLCDLIVMKNGEEVEGKVTEISSTEIKYKRCSYLDGPMYMVPKSDVVMIRYSNGVKEFFTSEKKEVDKSFGTKKDKFSIEGNQPEHGENQVEDKKKNEESDSKLFSMVPISLGMTITGLLITIFLVDVGLITNIGSLLFSIISIRIIKGNPEELRGLGMARLSLILSLVFIAFSLLVLVALLTA